jgi:hypothetical protein
MRTPTDHVYIIRDKKVGYTKIGHGLRPPDRLKRHQTGNPYPLEILFTFPGGEQTERALHQKFFHKQELGEWFDLSDEDIEWIRHTYNGRQGTEPKSEQMSLLWLINTRVAA